MSYPLLENAVGSLYYLNGEFISSDSKAVSELLKPTDDVTYYETVRIHRDTLLFFEEHLLRLKKSVEGVENFSLDISVLKDNVFDYIKELKLKGFEGNLRIVLTRNVTLFHLCEANIPSEDLYKNGINTNVLSWERVDPNIKVFRGEYKKAVASKFTETNSHGLPYEVLLADRNGKITEGSKSNFFAIVDGEVYSASDDVILIGITRKRVLESLQNSGLTLKIGTFTLEELASHKDSALFVSSTPFDILPITYVDDYEFNSVNNPLLIKIADSYKAVTNDYVNKNSFLNNGGYYGN